MPLINLVSKISIIALQREIFLIISSLAFKLLSRMRIRRRSLSSSEASKKMCPAEEAQSPSGITIFKFNLKSSTIITISRQHGSRKLNKIMQSMLLRQRCRGRTDHPRALRTVQSGRAPSGNLNLKKTTDGTQFKIQSAASTRNPSLELEPSRSVKNLNL